MEQNNYPEQQGYNQPQFPQQPPQFQQPYYGLPQMQPQMGFQEAVKTVLIEKYCCFTGRARRSEFWWWALASFLLSSVLSFGTTIYLLSSGSIADYTNPFNLYTSPPYIIIWIVGLALLLPNWGVAVRRLHDTGHSGWWFFALIALYIPLSFMAFYTSSNNSMVAALAVIALGFAMIALLIVILVWLCKDSDPGPNQYGPSPKYSTNE